MTFLSFFISIFSFFLTIKTVAFEPRVDHLSSPRDDFRKRHTVATVAIVSTIVSIIQGMIGSIIDFSRELSLAEETSLEEVAKRLLPRRC